MSSAHGSSLEPIVSLARAAAPLSDPGCDFDQMVLQLRPQVAALDDLEWAVAEEELLAIGVGRARVRALSAQRGEVDRRLERAASQCRTADLPSGHPVDTVIRENEAVRQLVAELTYTADLEPWVEGQAIGVLTQLRPLVQKLSETRNHQARVLNVLLPQLERRGVQGPTRMLWAYYSGVRHSLAALQSLLECPPQALSELGTALNSIVPGLIKSLNLSMEREERMVVPLLLRVLSEQEWAMVWHDSLSCGRCLIEPGQEYTPAVSRPYESEEANKRPDVVRFEGGSLLSSQLRGILAVLPFDLTFVDENDEVQFFTANSNRIFVRNLSVLGRKVQNCHPPSTIRLVNRILSDFRDGRRDVAEFWFKRRDQFIHVRYFAVRDDSGSYLGTLEVAQDLTPVRRLTGERRWLDDDGEGAGTLSGSAGGRSGKLALG